MSSAEIEKHNQISQTQIKNKKVEQKPKLKFKTKIKNKKPPNFIWL
jgi:hypothetical protein